MYVNSPVLLCSSYSTPPLAPLTDRNKPAVWAATPREAGWIYFGLWVVLRKSTRNIFYLWLLSLNSPNYWKNHPIIWNIPTPARWSQFIFVFNVLKVSTGLFYFKLCLRLFGIFAFLCFANEISSNPFDPSWNITTKITGMMRHPLDKQRRFDGCFEGCKL